jgi:1,4-dihydroxy-2-naphthoate octaprenyltransferase
MEEEAIKYLRKGKTMVLSTNGESMWAAKVFYCLDEGLVFLVEKNSRTLNNLIKNDTAVFTIDFNEPDIFIQGTGRVTILGEPRDFHKERGALLYKIPEDTLFVKSGHVLIARLVPDNIRVTDMRGQPAKYDLKIDTKKLTEKRNTRYFRALRPWSFQQSVTSLIFGALIAFHIDYPLLLLSVIALLLVHGSFNALSDYFDFISNTDKPEGMGSAGARILIDRHMPTSTFLVYAISLLLIGTGLGIYLIIIRPVILPYVIIGLIAGLLYGLPRLGWKRIALGDVAVFLAFGPGIFLGSYALQGGKFGLPEILISVSLGLIIVAILHGNNWRDIKDDKEAGVRTIANIIGDKGSEVYFISLIWLSYPLFIVAVVLEPRLFPILGALLTIPWAVRLTKIANNQKNIKRNLLDMLTARFTALHIYFAVIFLIFFMALSFYVPSLHLP